MSLSVRVFCRAGVKAVGVVSTMVWALMCRQGITLVYPAF